MSETLSFFASCLAGDSGGEDSREEKDGKFLLRFTKK
jgi:hypothetical protein